MMNFSGARGHKFAESPVLKLRLPAWRSRLMALLILACFAVLIGRSFYLQVLNNDFLQEKGESRYRRDLEISASRGRIAGQKAGRFSRIHAHEIGVGYSWRCQTECRAMKQLAGAEMNAKELQRKLAATSLSCSCNGNCRRRWATRWRH